ncbi:MAG: beta-ketoacyl-ACP synthase III [Bacteroidota bacterium]
MPNAKIAGLGFHVPETTVDNHELSKKVNTSDEWIRERSGIIERHYFIEGKDTVANMGAKAARMAIERAGIQAEDIDFIIFATLSPDYYFPGSGVLLQRELGIAHTEIPALDIRNQCSGFIYGISIADQFIKSGTYKNILLVGSEIQSPLFDYSDAGRHVTVLFGDGSGAAVIQATEESDQGVLVTKIHSDGTEAEKLAVMAPTTRKAPFISNEMIENGDIYTVMDGRFVFKMAVTKFPEVVHEALDAAKLTLEDIDLFIPHQANLRIAEAVRKNLGLPEEKVYNNIMRYGNTTAASIPIALTEAWEQGKVKKGDLVCLAAFGSGFTWGSTLIRW